MVGEHKQYGILVNIRGRKMSEDQFVIDFCAVQAAEGNKMAGSLADALRGIDPSLKVERVRSTPDSQDFGVSLAIVLGTTSVTAIAKGIAIWLARQPGPAKIEISSEGKVRATGLDSSDAARIAEAFAKRG
jgi:hypothetical protein